MSASQALQEQKKMPGYTGYKPQFADDQAIINAAAVRDNRFYIPGKSFSFMENAQRCFCLWMRPLFKFQNFSWFDNLPLWKYPLHLLTFVIQSKATAATSQASSPKTSSESRTERPQGPLWLEPSSRDLNSNLRTSSRAWTSRSSQISLSLLESWDQLMSSNLATTASTSSRPVLQRRDSAARKTPRR